MNILITGATGFLGSNLLARLTTAGHKVIILVRSSSSFKGIEPLLDKVSIHVIRDTTIDDIFLSNKIECIIHCATNYGRGEVNLSDLLDANLIMPLRLLQAGCKAGVHCFINTDTILDKGVNDYSLSKSQFQEWLKTYSQKMLCINIALEHFYGSNDNETKFVSYIVKQLLDKVDSIDLTEGKQMRDFIYIDDVVCAFQLIIDKCLLQQTGYLDFSIGTGIPISIGDFVKLAKKITGNTKTYLNFGALPYRKNEAMVTDVNIADICALGWNPSIKLSEGLTMMIKQEQERIAL